jgi:hypothetical protein
MCSLQRPTKENTHLWSKQYTSRTNQTCPIHSTRSNICSNNRTKFLLSHKCRARATHKPTSSANQQNTGFKKYDESLFEEIGTMLIILTTMLTKLK